MFDYTEYVYCVDATTYSALPLIFFLRGMFGLWSTGFDRCDSSNCVQEKKYEWGYLAIQFN